MNDARYIGVFDSGVGGLSILKTLKESFPNESFVYLGDTARLPYGSKSKETIKYYVTRNIDYLQKTYPLKAVVVACNSASSVLGELILPVKTIGVIEAGADAALSKTTSNKIGLWATKATVSSLSYEKEIKHLDPDSTLLSVSCPTLVALVEESGADHPLLNDAFEHYLSPIKEDPEIDTLILGCTHFPFFKEKLEQYLKKQGLFLNLVDASSEICVQLEELLMQEGLSTEKTNTDQVLVTDEPHHFMEFISSVMPEGYDYELKKIDL